jgi:hypothetical protein
VSLPQMNDVLIPSAPQLTVETNIGISHFAIIDADLQSDGTTQVALLGSRWLGLGTYPATYIVGETRSAGRFALHGCIRSGAAIQFIGVFMPALE